MLQDLLDQEKGYHNAKDDTVTLEVHVIADAPHGVRYVTRCSVTFSAHVGLGISRFCYGI